MKRHSIYILLILLGMNSGRARNSITAFQACYDHGLISIQQPFFSNRNSALLGRMQQYQAGVNFTFEDPLQSIISVSGPVQPNLGIGFTWERSSESQLIRTPDLLEQHEFSKNIATLGLGHLLFRKIYLGHQIGIRNLSRNHRILLDRQSASFEGFENDERSEISMNYRLGFYHSLTPIISVALLTPEIVQFVYSEQRLTQWNPVFKKDFRFFPNSFESMELAIEYKPLPYLSSVLMMDNEDDGTLAHVGVRFSPLKKLNMACGLDAAEKIKPHAYLGIGAQFRGFHGFASYESIENTYQISISFSPPNEHQFFQLTTIGQHFQDIFTYKYEEYQAHPFVSGTLKNLASESISLQILLEGAEFTTEKRTLVLGPKSSVNFSLSIPGAKASTAAKTAVCRFCVRGFYQGKQELVQDFPVVLKDVHHWNGELADLHYFIQPEHPQITAFARNILESNPEYRTAQDYAESVFFALSQRLRYLKDPVRNENDYVFYPHETLARGAGDCEDLAVLYCSILGALGMETALVEIKHPDKTEAHIFVLVNTRLRPAEIDFITENPERFILRDTPEGLPTAWIPVELTLPGESFDTAWQAAAREYQQQAIREGGLAEGWVKVR